MPVILEKRVEFTVDDLLEAVTQLSPAEMSEFELRLDELWVTRTRFTDLEVTQIADQYRLSLPDRDRVCELLARNRENRLQAEEERELDRYLSEMERRLEAVADEIMAQEHQPASGPTCGKIAWFQ